MKNYTIRDITEIGIFTGLAIILNLHVFSIHIMPNAGSISFSIIPLFIIALRKEWWKTLIATSLIYGLSACLMDGYGFQTYPLDYLLAYGSIVVVSLLRKRILNDKFGIIYLIVGVIISTLLRILFSTLSGMWIYEYTFLASFAYNATYISITGAIALGVLLLLFKPFKIINQRYPNIKEIQ
ncbi:MAG: energy-coupled thiamine transporter ThiT [Bacilli bacterium]|nr:energy-coupled thiamine transporter ThiT [Bacilli bacterium]